MVKTAVLVWFILIAGKPIGMAFETEMPSITACMQAQNKAQQKAADLRDLGIDIEVYTSCEQDR